MGYINNENRVRFLVESLKNDEKGYFLTVNALTKNREQFENQLLLLSLWLNDYCYGRRALKRDKRLTIFGGIEIGESASSGGTSSGSIASAPAQGGGWLFGGTVGAPKGAKKKSKVIKRTK
jgi:hypothetical protein